MKCSTIMIIDDQESICEVIQCAVELEGSTCLPFVDARAALAHLRDPTNCQPEMIFLDYMMPNCDGPTFLLELEQHGLRHRYSIVLFSARADLEQRKKALGCDAMLRKPFSLAAFYQIVETVSSG